MVATVWFSTSESLFVVGALGKVVVSLSGAVVVIFTRRYIYSVVKEE